MRTILCSSTPTHRVSLTAPSTRCVTEVRQHHTVMLILNPRQTSWSCTRVSRGSAHISGCPYLMQVASRIRTHKPVDKFHAYYYCHSFKRTGQDMQKDTTASFQTMPTFAVKYEQGELQATHTNAICCVAADSVRQSTNAWRTKRCT